MLFYLQMRWNFEGRLTQDQLWDLEAIETEHAQETIDSGIVKGIWKVAGQRRVICICDLPSAEELDRALMGRLPMHEYLEFEAIWPLRDYQGFAEDVKKHYRFEEDKP